MSEQAGRRDEFSAFFQDLFGGRLRDKPLCLCGHGYHDHEPLPFHPDGVEECQVSDCPCGKWRPQEAKA